jgi:hypothetical protein
VASWKLLHPPFNVGLINGRDEDSWIHGPIIIHLEGPN